MPENQEQPVDKQELGYHGMFSSREGDTRESYAYVNTVARACGKDNEMAVHTAVNVHLNTYIENLLENYVITPK